MTKPSRASSHETILLVEDREDVRTPLGEYLRRLGFTVLLAGDSSLALATAKEPGARIDVLLTDVNLPGIGGPDLAAAIRALHPEVSVVLMSGSYPEATLRDRLHQLGAAFLQKPFRMEELVELVKRR